MDVVGSARGYLRFDGLAVQQRRQRLGPVPVVANIKPVAHVDRQAAGLEWPKQELGDHRRLVLALIHQAECSGRPNRRAQLYLKAFERVAGRLDGGAQIAQRHVC